MMASHLRALGRPVLIGTDTVPDSERLSWHLDQQGVPHTVLNARHDRQEADIIAQAGRAGQVTVATRMAGRGTDIALDQAALSAGMSGGPVHLKVSGRIGAGPAKGSSASVATGASITGEGSATSPACA